MEAIVVEVLSNDNAISGAATGTAADHAVQEFAPRTDWSEMGGSEHFVQFYEADASLLHSLSGFIGAGLATEDACIVVATRAHREGLDERLQAAGLDITAIRASGQYVSSDAAETLSLFMVDGLPDPTRFAIVIGDIIERAAKGRRQARIFGEMVALLWAEGKSQAALKLEELWNDLHRSE